LGDGTQKPVRETEFLKDAREYVNAVASADFFSGAVLVGRQGQPVLEAAHGFANRRYGVRNTLDTPFNLASVTKMITAVAIAQLVDAGRLSFDDTVAKHLPNYQLPNADRITIHQLLTHTAGLGRGVFNESSVRDRVARNVSGQLAQTVAPAAFEPGASVQYNNEAWVVLGAIIERVTRRDYYSYVSERIYEPAGMVSSGNFHGDEESPVVATGYSHMRLTDSGAVFVPGARRNTWFISSISGSPAGGTYSTVTDLFRFVTALQQHKLLSPQATTRLLQQHVEQPSLPRVAERRGFGYGVETLADGWLRIVGKSGGAVGASAELKVYPQLGYTIVVLSNYDSAAPIVERRLRELMLGRR
jgi:CubicO group peptidase (beta-lactamase class C family)